MAFSRSSMTPVMHLRHITRYVAPQGVHVRFLRTPYLHTKLIAEPTQAFIGSENLKPLEPSS